MGFWSDQAGASSKEMYLLVGLPMLERNKGLCASLVNKQDCITMLSWL